MANGEPIFDFSEDKELMGLFTTNPFFIRGTDEIGETALVNWITDHYKKTFEKKISKQEVLGFLLKMVSENIIIRKSYGPKVLVLPTRNFFLVKNGKTPVKVKPSHVEKPKESAKTPDKEKNPKKSIEELSYQPLNEHHSYEEFLISRIASRPDHEREIIKYFPHLYALACKILNDEYTDWHTKMMISTALGYYILEEDIIPDYREHGYVDDLFILSYVLREIKKHVSPNIITYNWEYDEDILELIDSVYENTHKILGQKACDVLHLVGLWKFKRLELEEYQGSSNEKIEKLVREKRELLALIAYLVKIVYHADVSKKNLDYIKNYLKNYGDYDEINRLVLIATQGYDLKEGEKNKLTISDDDLEGQLQDSLLETLLED
jgi:uncharacterized membrane protein YkvA (DUF1232 family)